MKVTTVDYPHLFLGEGALWDERTGRYVFVDAARNEVHAFDPLTHERTVLNFESRTASVALCEDGSYLVVLADGIYTVNADGSDRALFADPDGASEPRNDYNDGRVDARGRFILGCANLPQEGVAPRAPLYSIEADGSWQTLDRNISISNGPAWSPDNSVFYHSDSLLHEIFAYDYDLATGSVSNKRVFARTHELGGIPDGATVDADGCLWVAICEGGKVVQYSPEGELLTVIPIPTPLTTSVCFGGEQLDQLFVTSIDPTWAGKAPDVNGGAVFVVDSVGARGVHAPRFAA